MKLFNYTKSQRGDTLVEVVISLAILAVTLVSAFDISNRSFAEGSQAREHSQAIFLAQDQAEKLDYYRDYLVAQNQSVTSVPSLITAGAPGNFGTCNGGCHVEIDGGGVPSLIPGPLPAAETTPFGNLKYFVQIGPLNPAGVILASQPDQAQLTVTVTWDAAISTGVVANGGTNENTTTLNVLLVDPRGILPRDCSVAGISACS